MKMDRWFGLMVAWVAWPMLVNGQDFNFSPTFAGSALALQAAQAGGDAVTVAETGLVPATGGERENSRPNATPVPGINARGLYAVTLGAAARNHSQASLVMLNATLGSHHVTAKWVEAEATATAEFLNIPTSGNSSFDGLTVDGHPVAVTGEANQTITFPDGYLIVNEQSGLSSPHFGTLTVNALHLMVDGAGSMIAASATVQVINAPMPNAGP
jgi:hypothetical protein